jgi:HAD superfamily hydrolase (TIGR01459 family)
MTSPLPTLPRLDLGLADLAPSYDLILCDVWGVVHNGIRANLDAVDALRKFREGGGTVVLLTNAPAPQAQVRGRLDSLAVPPDAYDDIATSGDVTVAMIVAAGCPSLFGIGHVWQDGGASGGELALYKEAARLGPRAPSLGTIEAAELAVCIGLDATGEAPEDYDDILQRLRARNLDLICANPDIVVEVGDDLVYCAGAIAERYTELGGTVVQAGKPFPAIYERAMRMASAIRGEIRRERVLAIGDAMHTDMRGARNQGFDALLVTSGIHRATLHRGGRGTPLDETALDQLLSHYGTRPLAAQTSLIWDRAGSR